MCTVMFAAVEELNNELRQILLDYRYTGSLVCTAWWCVDACALYACTVSMSNAQRVLLTPVQPSIVRELLADCGAVLCDEDSLRLGVLLFLYQHRQV